MSKKEEQPVDIEDLRTRLKLQGGEECPFAREALKTLADPTYTEGELEERKSFIKKILCKLEFLDRLFQE